MKSTTFILFLFFLTLSIQAQVVNQIGNSVKKSTETKATDFNRSRSNKEHNLNSPTPPAGGSNENASNNDSLKEKDEKNSEELINDANFKSEYVFNSKISYKVLSFADNELTETKFLNYVFNDSIFMFNADQNFMINDYKTSKMFMLDRESKAGMATALISPEIMKSTLSTGLMAMNYTKTGKTKEIAGFICSEYTYTDPQERKTSLWLSKENPFKDQTELVKTNIDLFFMNLGVISPEASSVTLGIDQLNENGQIESSILFDSFINEENRVNLVEYEITSY